MLKNLLLCSGIYLLSLSPAIAQNSNRPTPPGVPAYEFVRYDSSNYGYYLTSPFKINAGLTDPKYLMVLDAEGYLFWYLPVSALNVLDFKYHPEQQLYSVIKYISAQEVQYLLFNSAFEPVDTFYTSGGVAPDPHEFNITSGQTYLLCGIKDSIMDLHDYVFNGKPGSDSTNAIGFVVQEFDQDHELLFQWNSNDYIHPSQAYDPYGYRASGFDYCHGNAIFEDADGGLLLSFRNLNAVYKINRQTGAVEWRLGGKSSSFAFPGDFGFSGQHDVRRLPNGNITVFDNGNMTQPVPFSRAVEYALDTISWQAHKVWEYRYASNSFSPAMGNHQTTTDRKHLINYGLNYRPQPSFVLVDDNKNLLSELFFQDSVMSYRSFIFDLPVDQILRPAVSCVSDGMNITLSAPPGFAQYVWSTGASTPSITVTQPGTYQVWVDFGVGMLGSLPVQIDDVTAFCLPNSATEPQTTGKNPVMGYFDLLGRQVMHPQVGQLYVIRFANGQAKIGLYKD